MSLQKISFNWKSLTSAKLEENIVNAGADKAKVLAMYEATKEEGKVKRKSETHEITMPDWWDNLPSALAKGALLDVMATFCRSMYLDSFLPIGAHDWALVEKEMTTEGGGRKKLDFTDDLLAIVAASFGEYVGKAVGKPAVGERIKEATLAKFSMAGLQKHLNAADKDVIAKLQGRLDSWAAWLAENDSEKADEYASVYEYLGGRLAKNLEKLEEIPDNIAEII